MMRGVGAVERVITQRREDVTNAGAIATLAFDSVKALFSPGGRWLPEATVQMSLAIRRCFVPMIVSVGAFMLGYMIIVFGVVLHDLGATDRHAGGIFVALIRETAVWVTTMIFAGTAGSAVCADLGAQKIRDELDALSVMGVNQMRTIVLPRVIALTLAAPVLGMLALLMSQVLSLILSPTLLGYSQGIWVDSVASNILPLDVYASIAKYLIIGFFVGVVACQKGISAKGGTRGVGIAVNQTVVLTFLGIWLINSFFNLALLTLFPEASVVRG